jgi:hypothetical protein
MTTHCGTVHGHADVVNDAVTLRRPSIVVAVVVDASVATCAKNVMRVIGG